MTNQLQETSAGSLIMLVDSEMLGEPIYAVGDYRYLDLGGPCVPLLGLVILDYCLFCRCIQYHSSAVARCSPDFG